MMSKKIIEEKMLDKFMGDYIEPRSIRHFISDLFSRISYEDLKEVDKEWHLNVIKEGE